MYYCLVGVYYVLFDDTNVYNTNEYFDLKQADKPDHTNIRKMKLTSVASVSRDSGAVWNQTAYAKYT